VLIEIHGDDSMFGAMPPTFVANPQSEPADTQAILRDQLSTDQVTVSNLAEGGTASTILNLMAGVDGGGAPYAQRVMTSKAQIVLASYAVNDDLAQSLGPYTDALIAFVAATRAAGKIPVLEEPNPVCDDQHPNLQNYASTIDAVAQQYSVPLVAQYAELLTVPNLCSHFTQGIFPDNTILALKAQREAEVLQPIVQSLVK
jgi:acyl-CoA thioesterase-1